jgi:phosphohistidine phosphatase
MRLYIMRHAWAEEPSDFRYPDDSQRPLTDDGRRRFRRVAAKFVERGVRPTQIASSPYLRTMQSAEILAKELDGKVNVVEQPALAPGAHLESLLAWSAQFEDAEIAWVGHMPDVGGLTSQLIGAATNRIGFSKGAIAAIDFDGKPEIGRGILCWLITAKMLGC